MYFLNVLPIIFYLNLAFILMFKLEMTKKGKDRFIIINTHMDFNN